MAVRVLDEASVRALIGPTQALVVVADAFAELARGRATLPGVIQLDLPQSRGEVHVKGAHLHRSPFYSIKVAAGFYDNPRLGLPVGSGLVLVFDANTGAPSAILLDNGYLTELRTGAAGALAARHLARAQVDTIGFVGCGGQARYQLEALLEVRQPRRVRVWGRSRERAEACAREMTERFAVSAAAVSTAREAVVDSDIVVTVTPSREPLVRGEWLRPGTHVTAVGADGPDKRELDAAVLARADKVVVDSLDQCLRFGELHHAVAAGVLAPERVWAELGELAAGIKPGRTSDAEITVADLTGVGVQDAAVAAFVADAAREKGVGRRLDA